MIELAAKRKKTEAFDLESFLENPSLEHIDKCQIDDLVVIAKPILKKDLKSLVLGKLVELEVIMLPVLPDSPVCAPGPAGVGRS